MWLNSVQLTHKYTNKWPHIHIYTFHIRTLVVWHMQNFFCSLCDSLEFYSIFNCACHCFSHCACKMGKMEIAFGDCSSISSQEEHSTISYIRQEMKGFYIGTSFVLSFMGKVLRLYCLSHTLLKIIITIILIKLKWWVYSYSMTQMTMIRRSLRYHSNEFCCFMFTWFDKMFFPLKWIRQK